MPCLRRYQDDGLFDRFGYHASELWTNGRNVWADHPAGSSRVRLAEAMSTRERRSSAAPAAPLLRSRRAPVRAETCRQVSRIRTAC
ncbi:hypothetical protein GCM10010140_63450 [Streptosporangium pseudovulgare]|uniref:Uncharacterized protein n=2 Tax=Streptosporangium pseudovulgare TaxID=35765 RepID=A0ABQ2RFL5_9ACTN|nr:hypothetical protein GCM10010140_63450 [Streptosporangium pseudovulgare]